MKKKTITGIISVGVLGIAIVTGSYFSQTNSSAIDVTATNRSANDIAADEVVYLDDEALAASDSSSESTELRADALRAYNLVNEERENVGEDALTWDTNLESVSDVRAQEASQSFSHQRPNGKAWYTVNSNIQGGENLAYGQTTPQQVVDEWMASPTHKDNILYPEFNTVGIALYQNDSGVPYWALEFGY